MLRLIAGELNSGAGFMVRRKNLSIGYLHQDVTLTLGRSLLAEVLDCPGELARVRCELCGE